MALFCPSEACLAHIMQGSHACSPKSVFSCSSLYHTCETFKTQADFQPLPLRLRNCSAQPCLSSGGRTAVLSEDFLHSNPLINLALTLSSPTHHQSLCNPQMSPSLPNAISEGQYYPFSILVCFQMQAQELLSGVGFQLIKSVFQGFWPSAETIEFPCCSREEMCPAELYSPGQCLLSGTSSSLSASLTSSLARPS